MTNFLEETIGQLCTCELTPKDVRWVGNQDIWFSWDEFVTIADFSYDPGFGAQEVVSDIMVVGDGWYMDRYEYDGSEFWDFHSVIEKPLVHHVPRSLHENKNGDRILWESIKSIGGYPDGME